MLPGSIKELGLCPSHPKFGILYVRTYNCMSRGADWVLQSTGALEHKLKDEEKLLEEVQRDKDRYDERLVLEQQVLLFCHKPKSEYLIALTQTGIQ